MTPALGIPSAATVRREEVLDISMIVITLCFPMELCGGCALPNAGAAAEAANVGGYVVRVPWMLECISRVEVGTVGHRILIFVGTRDIIFGMRFGDIKHAVMKHQKLEMGVTVYLTVTSLPVTEVLRVTGRQGATCHRVALLGGRTRSAVLARVEIVGMGIVMDSLITLK